jgi:hypothetical protein
MYVGMPAGSLQVQHTWDSRPVRLQKTSYSLRKWPRSRDSFGGENGTGCLALTGFAAASVSSTMSALLLLLLARSIVADRPPALRVPFS